MAALSHTNAVYRPSALESPWPFYDELLKQKDILIKLTQDKNEFVQMAALGALLQIVQADALRKLMPPSEIEQAAQAVAESPGASTRTRDFAMIVVGLDKERI